MEVATSLVSSRLNYLVENVKDLVGEINFDSYIEDEGTKREKFYEDVNNYSESARVMATKLLKMNNCHSLGISTTL